VFHTPKQVGGACAIKEAREPLRGGQIWPSIVSLDA